jgi:hypothetical protein
MRVDASLRLALGFVHSACITVSVSVGTDLCQQKRCVSALLSLVTQHPS